MSQKMQDISFRTILKALTKLHLPVADLVLGIGEGGVVPAALVASKLGCDLKIVRFKYRDRNNKPAYSHPVLKSGLVLPERKLRILLVDDVSVSGKTLRAAKKMLKGRSVKTMVFKGKADVVLLPEITDCIRWPWKT